MKLPFLISVLCLHALSGLSQTNVSRPTMGQIQDAGEIPPGTIKIEVSPLESTRKDNSCRQEMQQIGLKIIQVIAVGSGLVNSLSVGDSLNIRILKGMDFSKDQLSEKDTLLLKEQLCSFEETYFTLIRKE